MSSSRQLLADGHAKRADLVKVLHNHIHIELGFNAPESAEEFKARVRAMADHLKEGGRLPPIEVRDRDEGGVYVVDGHGRHAAYALADKEGVSIRDPKDGMLYMLTMPFTGNDADRVLRTITSAEGRTLTPLQLADRYKRLQAFGWSAADIARKVGKTSQHVGQVLALGNANTDVQQMVQAGETSATEAVKAVKKHKEKAGAVLKEQLVAAKKAGKTKVTSAVVNADKKAVKARENADLLADAEMFRWLVTNGSCGLGVMGNIEVSFECPTGFAGYSMLRDSVRSAMEVQS